MRFCSFFRMQRYPLPKDYLQLVGHIDELERKEEEVSVQVAFAAWKTVVKVVVLVGPFGLQK